MFSSSFHKIVDYFMEVARGDVLYSRPIHKFGLAEDLDPADGQSYIWDGCASDIGGKITQYNWWDSPLQLQISSTNTLDTDVDVEVTGNNGDGSEYIIRVSLNGQVGVNLPSTWTAINTARTKGPQASRGNIFISDSSSSLSGGRPTDDLTIRAIIHQEKQRTQMALYTVPSNETLYIKHAWCHISKATTTEALVEIYSQPAGDPMHIVHTIGLSSIGAGGDHRPYEVPIAFEGGSRLTYRATAFANNTAISAGFHGVLIKESG